MSAEIKNERGTISISNAVIAKLAGYTATQCYGVVGMCSKTGKDGIASLLKKENIDKGIKVKTDNGVIDISLFVIVEYGLNIGTIGETIRSNVKYNVEKFTGMEVSRVSVNVESVRVEQ
ncbi:MAG: Asp23/Gls24 family envelope stress response protein [Ruminococcaceae bacterium]|nr:Asp23/Gls24 family envelope stress response protein [Oscillospiraceae bacterium]